MAAPSAIPPSDALVFFGASGDLAYEQIFPSLLGLVRDEAWAYRSSGSPSPTGTWAS